MLSQTRRALEDFDNQHDFERMAADILNALGYSNVEPMAPGGGADGGQDIKFREGDSPGIAFVTLEKNIRSKFKRDLAKQNDSEGVIGLFCNVDVSPTIKLSFAKEAINKGYRLEVFDLERLRSLLDSSLRDVRRRYLKIDDEVAAQLRSEVRKLLRFPAAIPDVSVPPALIEIMLVDKLPCRLFDLLIRYEEKDIVEVPEIGGTLHNYLTAYYQFRQKALQIEDQLVSRIGEMVICRFREAWEIYYKYVMIRFGGNSKEDVIAGGNFLNYSITWDDAERVFISLSSGEAVASMVSDLFLLHKDLVQRLYTLSARDS
ncbi:hypothetical protein [Nostoc sp. DedQUE04]|uniref:hypothetical protein n=1 Tax=Nostoc sp. DedQUE04 TaxID=3075390 RepID=UPI002AD3A0E8|nr:hypothetical protein [Nostoc sp. DedQUE04]